MSKLKKFSSEFCNYTSEHNFSYFYKVIFSDIIKFKLEIFILKRKFYYFQNLIILQNLLNFLSNALQLAIKNCYLQSKLYHISEVNCF